MKKIITVFLILLTLSFVSCGEVKTLHCDSCGKAVEVDADSNMEEEWTIYCGECEHEKGLDTLIVED